ncbi:Replication factor C subunit 3 [Striga hermonthica]|uniref:Replication factor C subunit 3 n=1 Tax=Striga hermonthica TaxID=68872 RepID=A0A9N7MM31_STRHE|nr:Replication factor C subunit 3 [Striga hermonthica]
MDFPTNTLKQNKAFFSLLLSLSFLFLITFYFTSIFPSSNHPKIILPLNQNCAAIEQFPDRTSRCDFVRSNYDSCRGKAYLNYLDVFYCGARQPFGYAVLVLWLVVLFYVLGDTASTYFCPSVTGLSRALRLSPALAGTTLLPLGNGANDVFAAVVSFARSDGSSAAVGLNGVLGGALFITCFVVGLLSFVARARVVERAGFIRDILFLLFALGCLFAILALGRVGLWAALGFVSVYAAYILAVFGMQLRRSGGGGGELVAPLLDEEKGLLVPEKSPFPTLFPPLPLSVQLIHAILESVTVGRLNKKKEKEMLWVDKYRPKTLEKVLVHEDIAQNLKKLVTEQDCPHLLFYGPSGSGKKTLIMALLRQIYGPSADKVKVENKNWKVDAGSRTIDVELTTLSSTHHVELSPSDAGFQDRYVVQEIIKEMAKNRPIDTKGKKGFKVLVLNEVDKLSREAQHSLRRTMEKYSSSCRLILCCNSSSKVTEAIRSRCLNMRINAPTDGEIVKVLEFIGKKEGLQLPSGFADRIAQQSNRSLRRAILSLEACRVQQYPFTANQPIPPMDWEEYVSEIASSILKEQSPKRLFEVRGKVYELLVNCIPPEIILKRLLYELLKKLDSELKHEISHWAAYYEHRLRLGQKAIFHLEAFVAKFMSVYKGFLIETFG